MSEGGGGAGGSGVHGETADTASTEVAQGSSGGPLGKKAGVHRLHLLYFSGLPQPRRMSHPSLVPGPGGQQQDAPREVEFNTRRVRAQLWLGHPPCHSAVSLSGKLTSCVPWEGWGSGQGACPGADCLGGLQLPYCWAGPRCYSIKSGY